MEPEEITMVINFLQLLVLLFICYMLWDLGDMAETGLREFLRR